jgi:hypothetical protein
MLNKLFYELLEKLKTETQNDSKSISGCFNFFVENILEEKFNKPNYVSSRTLTNYYSKYVEKENNNSGEPKTELKDIIAQYIGYNDFADFEVSNKTKGKTKTKSFSLKQKTAIGVAVLLSIAFTTYYFSYSYKSSSCIIWKENHFVKSSCDNSNSLNNSIYNIDLKNFEKIKVDENFTFFKNERPAVWYGKNKNIEMEFFSDRGVHPETLKELKPITETIINNYVLKNKADKTILK